MASSLITYYCFNDNDTTLVHDFSGNERHSTTETGLTITTQTGAIGKVGYFNGSNTEIFFSGITGFNALTAFSCVVKIKINSFTGGGAGNNYIAYRSGSFYIAITDTGGVEFNIYDSGAVLYQLTHAAGIVTGEWYTLVFTWDGENQKFYNGSSTADDSEGAAFLETDTVANDLILGSLSGGNTLDAYIEMISFYSKALTADEINAVMETPSGIRYEAGDGMIQTGDLIYNNNGSKEVCTWSEEFDEMEFKDNEQQLFADGELQIFKN